MYGEAEIERCLALNAAGLNATQIARRSGIPRATVRDWLNGRTPRRHHGPGGTCVACGHPEHRRDRLPPEYVYVLATYLGDGCLSAHPRGVYRLRVTLDTAYPAIIAEVAAAMRTLVPTSSVGLVARRCNCVDVSSYSRAWPCLLPQHGPGPKHKRRIRLEAWQWMLVEERPELLLRGLIHSDGCRFENTGRRGWRHPRYVFSNRSSDIRHVFTEACGLLGLSWTPTGHVIYVSRKADVARMDEFIGPKA